jgi:hypothetical protein
MVVATYLIQGGHNSISHSGVYLTAEYISQRSISHSGVYKRGSI